MHRHKQTMIGCLQSLAVLLNYLKKNSMTDCIHWLKGLIHMHSHAHKLCLTNNAWGKYWHHINAF